MPNFIEIGGVTSIFSKKLVDLTQNDPDIDAVDGDTIVSIILEFGSIPTILAGVTRGPQNDHS